MAEKIIKTTKYCNIISQAKLEDDEYTYCIEIIYVNAKERDEIRFSLYKDTIRAVIWIFTILRRIKDMKRILCIGVIKKGKMTIKTCNTKEGKGNV